MNKQKKAPITVVSEALLFVGVRVPRAWVWVEVGPAPTPASVPQPVVTDADRLFRLVAASALSAQERQQCRQIVRRMSPTTQRELLRAARKR